MLGRSARFSGAGGGITLNTFVRACVLAIFAFGLAGAVEAQVNSRPGAVVLVARISDQVGVQWGSQRVTHLLEQYDLLPENSAKQNASALVFQNTMHLGMGNVVSGETMLEAPDGRSEMMVFDPAAPQASTPVWSLLATSQPTPRWRSGDPRSGRHQVTQACLVVSEDGAAPTVRVRLTAL